jgi:Restriction endonuclease BglI
MFHLHTERQFNSYNMARNALIKNPNILIDLEKYLTDHLKNGLVSNLSEIKSDYNEASFLYPFWRNCPPDDRGRQPVMDQYPWIEVGEHSIGCKIPRILDRHFSLRDAGLPTGADQRFLLKHEEIEVITQGLTNTAWLFIDIKSVGPRDDQDHTVMSHNQVSGDGIWEHQNTGIINTVFQATGSRSQHEFHSSMPPIFVLSDGTIAPVVIMALKPVYAMLPETRAGSRNDGQPIIRLDLACIPNGLLLTKNPGYLRDYPGLLFPGKDDKKTNPKKLRARIDFELLRIIDSWRYQSIKIQYP